MGESARIVAAAAIPGAISSGRARTLCYALRGVTGKGSDARDRVDEAGELPSWLQRLGERIPGFAGYRDAASRRGADRAQREHLAGELARIKMALRGIARSYAEAGRPGEMAPFERLAQRLEGLMRAIRSTDYEEIRFFDVADLDEAELERLYRLDLSLLEDVERLEGTLASLPEPGAESPEASLHSLLDQIRQLEEKWRHRQSVIAGVLAAAPAG